MRIEMMHPADQLVLAMRQLYGEGYTTLSGGNLSIREPDGSLWVTPSGGDKGALQACDIVRIATDGSLTGSRAPTSELSFHQAVYRVCGGAGAVLHAHSPALMTFSVRKQVPDTRLVPNAHLLCGDVGFAPYARMHTSQLADRLAVAFAKGYQAVLMENHGICIAGANISDAFRIFETLEHLARQQIKAERLGPLNPLSDEEIELASTLAHTRLSDFMPRRRTSEELGLRRDMIAIIHRALSRSMFTSAQGTLSAALSDGSFLITPFATDRREVDGSSLVLVRRGMKEHGKTPSRAVFLHELIYRRRPDVKAIIGGQPTNLMAYCLSDCTVDACLMPESYVLLRDLPRYPYGINYREPQRTATLFTARSPGIMFSNDGVIMTGDSLIQAYDRLEVADFTAGIQLDLPGGRPSGLLTAEQIAELDLGFPLPDNA